MTRADPSIAVEITPGGDLRLSAEVAAEYFPSHSLVAILRGGELWLLPLVGPEGGGLLLKQRNSRGDRSALIRESLPHEHPVGERTAVWDATSGALRVDVR
jgi:hypothetical protein